MSKETKYQVIISDKAKQMIGMHIRFMAQVNREAASSKRKELIAAMRSLEQMPQRFPFLRDRILHRISTIKCLWTNGI